MSATKAVTQLAIRLTSGSKDPIRGVQLPDDRRVFSVYDAMWNTGAYPSYDAARAAWSRLIQSEFKDEILLMTCYLKFAGPGQRHTPCMVAGDLLKVVARLSRKKQKAYWLEVQHVLERYLDGDTSVCVEVEENKRIGGDEARALFALKVEARADEMSDDDEAGYVYGMVSNAFPDLVKIGRTCDLERRLTEANIFCAPMPFRYVATHATPTPRLTEGRAHKHFAGLRRAGEFFEVDAEAVQAYFVCHIAPP